jgi:hypothetical protein
MAKVPLVGTSYVPGVTEERALAEIRELLLRQLDPLPVHDPLPD